VRIGRFSGLHWKITTVPTLAPPARDPDGTFTIATSTPGEVTATGHGVGTDNGKPLHHRGAVYGPGQLSGEAGAAERGESQHPAGA